MHLRFSLHHFAYLLVVILNPYLNFCNYSIFDIFFANLSLTFLPKAIYAKYNINLKIVLQWRCFACHCYIKSTKLTEGVVMMNKKELEIKLLELKSDKFEFKEIWIS